MGNTAMITAVSTATPQDTWVGGGGIYIDGYRNINDNLTIENNHIIGNVTVRTMTTTGANSKGHAEGGGLHVSIISTTVIINNEVRGNTAVENLSLSGGGGSDNWGGRPSGGGIHLRDNDTVTLSNNEIRDNVTAEQQVVNNVDTNSEGGGIAIANVDNTTLNNNTISGNTAVATGSITSNAGRNYYASGGGIMVGCWDKPSCNLSFTGNDVLNNATAYTITVSGTNANGGANGGGIEVGENVSATLQNNTVSGNVAYQQAGPSDGCAGGGMDVNKGTVTMSQNRFLDNRTSPSGWGAPGAVWVWQGSLTSINDIFARNLGGVGVGTNGPPSNMTIINDTFHNNGHVGIAAHDTSTVYVTNTIVYSHQEGLREDASATLIEDYNLLSNTTNYDGGVTTGTHTLIDQDPLFENAAADNFYLIDGSPAIDAGTSVGAPSVDFEGDTRDALVDIGADEWRIGQGASGAIYLPVILKASP
jgi:hypothetical protein